MADESKKGGASNDGKAVAPVVTVVAELRYSAAPIAHLTPGDEATVTLREHVRIDRATLATFVERAAHNPALGARVRAKTATVGRAVPSGGSPTGASVAFSAALDQLLAGAAVGEWKGADTQCKATCTGPAPKRVYQVVMRTSLGDFPTATVVTVVGDADLPPLPARCSWDITFALEPARAPAQVPEAGAQYYIRAAGTDTYVVVLGGSNNGSVIGLRKLEKTQAYLWEVTPWAGGVRLVNPQSGRCLHNHGGTHDAGASVTLWDRTHPGNNVTVVVEPVADDRACTVSFVQGLRLTRTGELLTQQHPGGGEAQRFFFEPAEP